MISSAKTRTIPFGNCSFKKLELKEHDYLTYVLFSLTLGSNCQVIFVEMNDLYFGGYSDEKSGNQIKHM